MSEDLLTLTADIVSAHVGNNVVAVGDLPNLISSVHKALSAAAHPIAPTTPKEAPAVPVRSSVKPDYLVSLESGKKLKMLKRYLMTNYGMTPDQYRAKWGHRGITPWWLRIIPCSAKSLRSGSAWDKCPRQPQKEHRPKQIWLSKARAITPSIALPQG
jgi:predicted transcriptional regulator